MRALFDTGSANTWILSKNAKTDKHNFYDPEKSSSAKMLD
jgi:hypothetical protein